MNKFRELGFIGIWPFCIFLALVLFYFRFSLFTGSDSLITRHLGTDLYIYLMHAHEGFGAFSGWVPHGGGFPATSFDLPLNPSNLMLMGLLKITSSDYMLSLKLLMFTIYMVNLSSVYWLARILFKDSTKWLAILVSMGVCFSTYGVGQLEHPDLLIAISSVALLLSCLEMFMRDWSRIWGIALAGALLLLFITHLYPFYFACMYMPLRVVWGVRGDYGKLITFIPYVTLAGICILPLALMSLGTTPSSLMKEDLEKGLYVYAQHPGLFFVRDLPSYMISDARNMYLGLSLVILCILPLVKVSPLYHRISSSYTFYYSALALIMMYSVGHFSPINFAQLIHDHLPFSYFIRVPGRAMIIGYFCLVLGGGYALKSLNMKSWMIAGCCLIVFVDIGVGFEPPTMYNVLNPQNEKYTFLRGIEGDFRLLEFPMITTQMATTTLYTGHDTLSPTRWAYNYYEPLYAPANLYNSFLGYHTDYLGTRGDLIEPDSCKSFEDLGEEAAFYGVRYLIFNTGYFQYPTYAQALKDINGPNQWEVEQLEYNLKSSDSYFEVFPGVYEVKAFKGMVYAEGVDIPLESNWDRDKINIVFDSPTLGPAIVHISQCYDKNWKARDGEGNNLVIDPEKSMQKIELEKGVHSITLEYKGGLNRWL